MISHNEAQALISARQDQVLDPIVEHELNAHLATCDSCRAFARSTDTLTQGLRTLPYMPASPAVRRAVLDRVEQGRSPFARFAGMFETAPGPALSTLALIALVVILGFFALDRFVLQDQNGDGDEQRQLASQPTEQAPATETPVFTVTPDPTDEPVSLMVEETPTPTEAPTETPAPTEQPTEAAEPTEPPTEAPATEAPTDAPTETPEPTEAPTEEPTEEPTEAPTEEPTEAPTKEPTETPTKEPTEEPADLTIASLPNEEPTPEPTATATAEPTATTSPTATSAPTKEPTEAPTETPEPTEAPTEEPTAEPTATTEPTAEPTDEPTEEPTEDAAPQIVPIDGSDPVTAPEDEAGTADDGQGRGSAGDEKASRPAPTIEPIDGETVTEQGGQIEAIEPIETPAVETTPDATMEADVEVTEDVEPETTEDLSAASVGYQDIAGEPGGRLLLTDEGRMVFGAQPHAPTMVTPAGRTLDSVETENGTAVALCYADGACTDVSSGSREGSATDIPLGIIGADVIYMRETGSGVEYRRSSVEGETVIADDLLYSGDAQAAPHGAIYSEDGRLWIPTVSGDWVMLTDSEGTLLSAGYADPQLVRFANTGRGLLMGFVSGGQLIIVEAENPASPILALPFNGADFDIAPQGDKVVVSTGSSLDIYTLDGALVTSYAADDVQPGTVLWLNGGIVYADQETGALYQIPETAN